MNRCVAWAEVGTDRRLSQDRNRRVRLPKARNRCVVWAEVRTMDTLCVAEAGGCEPGPGVLEKCDHQSPITGTGVKASTKPLWESGTSGHVHKTQGTQGHAHILSNVNNTAV